VLVIKQIFERCSPCADAHTHTHTHTHIHTHRKSYTWRCSQASGRQVCSRRSCVYVLLLPLLEQEVLCVCTATTPRRDSSTSGDPSNLATPSIKGLIGRQVCNSMSRLPLSMCLLLLSSSLLPDQGHCSPSSRRRGLSVPSIPSIRTISNNTMGLKVIPSMKSRDGPLD